MSTTATLASAKVLSSGEAFANTVTLVLTGTIAPSSTDIVLVASTNVSVTVPAGAAGCVVIVPSSNTGTLYFKTTSGDTGVQIPTAAQSPFAFEATAVPATIYLNGSVGGSTVQVQFF